MLESLKHIRDSGLLELYVIGELSPGDVATVEAAIELYPELKTDLNLIEKALHTYAEAHSIKAPQSVLNKVLSKIESDKGPKVPAKSEGEFSGVNKLLVFTLLATFGTLLFQLYDKSKLTEKHAEEVVESKDECSEEKQLLLDKLSLYKELEKLDNRSINVSATEKYPQTQIILNTNEVTQRNILQFKFLPPLESNQSYQLWSLKGDSDPIPLNVFEDISELLEVDFIDGTNAYAITIEPKGGLESPTLENLIGVFSIAG
jgi:anti-sigma-K factor RskA